MRRINSALRPVWTLSVAALCLAPSLGATSFAQTASSEVREAASTRLARIAAFLESDNENQRAAALRQLRDEVTIDDLDALRRSLTGRPPREVARRFLERWDQLTVARIREVENRIAEFESARLRARRLAERLTDVTTAASERPADGTTSEDGSPTDPTPNDDTENLAADLDLARSERDELRERIRSDYRFLLDQGLGMAPARWTVIQRGGRVTPAVERFREQLGEDLVREARRLYPTPPDPSELGSLDERSLAPLLAALVEANEEPKAAEWAALRARLVTQRADELYSFDPFERARARTFYLELGDAGTRALTEWVDAPPPAGARWPREWRRRVAQWNRWAVPVGFVDEYSLDVAPYAELPAKARWELIARLEWTAGEAAIPIFAALLDAESEIALEVELAAALARLADLRGVLFLQRLGLEDVVALERVSRRVLLLEAIHRREAGEYDQAIEELQSILKRFPADHRVHYELGYAALLARRLTLSIEHFRLALDYEPDDRLTHYNLACALSLDGQLDDAMAELRRAANCGFRDASHIAADTDLANLRGREDFRALIDELSRS